MNQSSKDWILQDDSKHFLTRIGTEPWISFPPTQQSESGLTALFCAFIPIENISAARERVSWELSKGDGLPSCMIYNQDGKEKTVYLRFGGSSEPLLIYREFYGMRPNYVEISEEFRLFHRLYFDRKNNKYIKIDDRGNEEDSIFHEGETIKVRLKHIRQFLAIKEMAFAVYFDIHRWAEETLNDLELRETVEEVRQDDLIYEFAIRDMSGLSERSTLSRLVGKKLIYGYEKEKSGFWPYDEPTEEKYENFIIDIDNDEPILYSCNPDGLANNFGANPNSPHYLTSVFFKREVLAKYYSNPQKYHVQDNLLRCGSLWSMRIDNNHSTYIIAYLGDLGRDLSYEEQLYWKSFNVIPDGTISETEYRRAFLAQFADPEQADLRFKSTYESFCSKWMKHKGWPLFKPVNEEDRHVLTALHIPLNNDFIEFDTQTLNLTKLLVDSLNDAELQKYITHLEVGARSIKKFEIFLKENTINGFEPHVQFLRDLYQLRSMGAGHRRGSDFTKKTASFGMNDKDLSQIFEEFLNKGIEMLLFLEEQFLIKP